MKWWVNFKKYFVPSDANEHQPYFLREWNIFGLLTLIVLLEGAAVVAAFFILPRTPWLLNYFPEATLEIINQERAQSGLQPLAADATLTLEASQAAVALAARGALDPSASQYQALNFFDAADLVHAWGADSALSHEQGLRTVGIGIAVGTYQDHTALYAVALSSPQAPGAVMPNRSLLPPRLGQALDAAVNVAKPGFWAKAATRPHAWATNVYLVLLTLTLIAFLCNLLLKIRIQHLALLVNGFLLILLLVGLLFINDQIFSKRILYTVSDGSARLNDRLGVAAAQ